jgi:hypothetical protein
MKIKKPGARAPVFIFEAVSMTVTVKSTNLEILRFAQNDRRA